MSGFTAGGRATVEILTEERLTELDRMRAEASKLTGNEKIMMLVALGDWVTTLTAEIRRLRAAKERRATFEAVISTPNGGWSVAEEYRCTRCGAIGVCAGADNITLADLDSLADRHECLPRVDRKDAGGAA